MGALEVDREYLENHGMDRATTAKTLIARIREYRKQGIVKKNKVYYRDYLKADHPFIVAYEEE